MDLQQPMEASGSYGLRKMARGLEQVESRIQDADADAGNAAAQTAPLSADSSGARRTEQKGVDSESVRRMLDEAQSKLEMHGVELRFKVDQEAGAVQVEVRDSKTDKVIRKIPEDELLRLSSHIKDFNGNQAGALAGALMDKPV